jgi:hypothetical protein
MQSLIRQLLIISVLFMGADGAWDLAIESHLHGDQHAHQSDVDGQNLADPVDTGPDPLADADSAHCEHLCHGHMTSIAANLANFGLGQSDGYYSFEANRLTDRSQAPPTPPPNA